MKISISRTKDKLSEAQRAEESASQQIKEKEKQRAELRTTIDVAEARMSALEVDKTRLSSLLTQNQQAEQEQKARKNQHESELKTLQGTLQQAELAAEAARRDVDAKRSDIETKRRAV